MASVRPTESIIYTSNVHRALVQEKSAWYKLSTRSISTYLSKYYCVHGKHNVLNIERSDKIIILLRFNNTFTIYRPKDKAVAVLQNVTFKQPDPPVMFEISQLAESVDGIRMVLMYAVALKDWTNDTKIKFNEGDLVLILADIRQEEYVGITILGQVGVFPSGIVRIITNPRRLLMDGVRIRMECAYFKDPLELQKADGVLFTWKTDEGVVVPLKEYTESGFNERSVRYSNYRGVGNDDENSYEELPARKNFSYPEKPVSPPPFQASRSPPTATTESNESQSDTTEKIYDSPPPIRGNRKPSVTTEGDGSQSDVKKKTGGTENDETTTPDSDDHYSEIPQQNAYQKALNYLLDKGCMVVPEDLHGDVADHLIEDK